MAEFKKGDKVRCIKASMNGYPGIVGKVYEVRDVDNSMQHGGHIYLITDEPCANLGCQAERFELVTQADTPEDEWQGKLRAALDAQSAYFGKPVKRERVPDELDWDKHKQFMKSL